MTDRLVYGAVGGGGGSIIYPVVDGCLRCHPGLSDPRVMSGDCDAPEGRAARLTGLAR